MQRIELIGLEKLDRNLSVLEREVYPKAAARAANSTATTVRKESIKTIAKRMGVKQSVVRGRTQIRKASASKIESGAEIAFKGRAMNLIRFKARQRQKGVSASPWGKRRIFAQTFIVDLGRGKFVGVRKRVGGNTAAEKALDVRVTRRVGRTPVVGVVGPGVAPTAAEPDIARQRRETVRSVFPTRLRKELAFYLSKVRG